VEVGADDIVFIDEHATPPGDDHPSFGPELMSLDYHNARDRVLARFEVEYLTHVVHSSDGNISDAARMAGVDRTTLYRLMDKHDMGRESLAHSSGDSSTE
jgi:DNA-binding NtrC family response regulator